MEDFSLLYWIMEKHAESEKDMQPLPSASAKKTRKGNECAAFGCSNTFYDSEGTATGINIFKFPSLPSEINRWCNLIKRKITRMGLVFPPILFYVTTILRKKILKSHFWDGSCYHVFFPHKTYQVKSLHQNKNKSYQ